MTKVLGTIRLNNKAVEFALGKNIITPPSANSAGFIFRDMEEKTKKNQSFWVVIPTLLLEDDEISIKGKRLYALISSLCKKEGYCWASNKFLSDILKIPLSTIRFNLKKLEQKKWIKSEVNKEEGNTRRIFLNMPELYNTYANSLAEGYANAPEEKKQSYANAPEENVPNINKDINNKYTISKEIGKPALSYGNEDINYLIGFLKEKTGLVKLDGTENQNRRYCWLALKKFGGRQKVEAIMKMALRSDFHRKNLTSLKYIYYNGVKIVSEFKEEMENPRVAKIR